MDGRGKVLAEIAEGIGVATNNVAEYRAAIAGLAKALELGATDVLLRSDSRLLIEQLGGRFRVKHPTLQRLNQEARRLLAEFPAVRLEQVPRERNKEPDRLANLGVDEWLAGEGAGYEKPGRSPQLFEEDGPAGGS